MILDSLRPLSPPTVLAISDLVCSNLDAFVGWPAQSLLLWPGQIRLSKGFYSYPDSIRQLARAVHVPLDTRTNGPAIASFLLAGGVRPQKIGVKHGWSIHHIYDGCHPAPGFSSTVHAVKCGDLFTEAAGLVAVHPIADSLASEVPWFAWYLRKQAFDRFGFDPDGVFGVQAKMITATDSADSPQAEGVTTMADSPRATIRSTRLHFKADVIEPLADDDIFEIQTPDATWRMTKAQFAETFPNVLASESYSGSRREYFYTKPPGKADKFRV